MGAYTGPSSWQSGSASLALGLRSPKLPISPAAMDGAQRDPAAAAAAAASPITGRMPGRALPAAPTAPQPPSGLERSYTQLSPKEPRSAALLPAPPPAPAAFGERGIGAEEAPAAADDTARKQRPGRCCYPTPPTPSGCNALRPASAPLLLAGAGLVRAAVCRCGSSPSPRCPPPPRVPRPPPCRSPAPGAATATATEVGDAPLFYGRAAWASLRAAKALAMRAQSAGTRMPAAERSGAPS